MRSKKHIDVPADEVCAALMAKAIPRLLPLPNVHSLSFGRPTRNGVELDTFGLIVKVSKKLPPEALDRALLVPREFEGLPTDVVEASSPQLCSTVIDTRPTGIDLDALNAENVESFRDLSEHRPLRAGTAFSFRKSQWPNEKLVHGTLGFFVRRVGAPAEIYGVTNYHNFFPPFLAGRPQPYPSGRNLNGAYSVGTATMGVDVVQPPFSDHVIGDFRDGRWPYLDFVDLDPEIRATLTNYCHPPAAIQTFVNPVRGIDVALIRITAGVPIRSELPELGKITGARTTRLTENDVQNDVFWVLKRGSQTRTSAGVVKCVNAVVKFWFRGPTGARFPAYWPMLEIQSLRSAHVSTKPHKPSDGGDSGSGWFDPSGAVIGLHAIGGSSTGETRDDREFCWAFQYRDVIDAFLPQLQLEILVSGQEPA